MPPILLAVRQRAADDQRIDTRAVHGDVRDRAALRPARHPDRPGLDRESFSHLKADWPHLDRITRPGALAPSSPTSAASTTRSACTPGSATSPPMTSTTAAAPDPRRPQTRATTRPLGPNRLPSNPARQSQPPEPVRCGLIRSPICGFDSDTPQGESAGRRPQQAVIGRPRGGFPAFDSERTSRRSSGREPVLRG